METINLITKKINKTADPDYFKKLLPYKRIRLYDMLPKM